jgi:acid phosphatase (class A)
LGRASGGRPPSSHPTATVPASPTTHPLDLKALLPDPPADDSDQTRRELGEVLDWQNRRTPADVARAQAGDGLSPWLFADVLGPWFTPERLPATAAVLKRLTTLGHDTSDNAKLLWKRARPSILDPRIKPCLGVPWNSAYPSGHAACGQMWALALAQLLPEQRDVVLARGKQYGLDRVVGGVHYPSDVAAGQKMGQALFAQMMATPGFQAELDRAREEIRAKAAQP